MASVKRAIEVVPSAQAVWDVIRDIGALHTRLVPGFVIDTRLDGDARIVTFGNGMVVREPIVDIDENEMRVAWTAESPTLDHYNGSVRVEPRGTGCCVTWRADFLPHERLAEMAATIEQGMAVMKRTLDELHE